MKGTFVLVIGACLLVSCGTTSKRVAQFVVPEIRPDQYEPVDIAAYEQKYGKEDGVYLSYERTMEHYGAKVNEDGAALFGVFATIGAGWNYVDIVMRKFLVLNPDAQWLTTFSIGYKPKSLYLRVTTPDGNVRQYGLEDLQEEKDERGGKNYKFAYPDIVKGTIIEEGIQITFEGQFAPMDYDIPLQFSIPCEKLKMSYAYPDWWGIMIKDIRKGYRPNYILTTDKINHKNFLTFEAIDIPAYQAELFAPYFKEIGNYLEFMVTELSMKTLKMDRPTDWVTLNERIWKSFFKKSEKNQKVIESTAHEIIKGCRDQSAQIDSVLAFIYANIRVSDMDVDADYAKILEKREGSNIDICGLTHALLQSLGLKVDLVLVHSARDGYFDPSFVNLGQFSCPAVTVKMEEDTCTLLPYVGNLPSNHTPEDIQGQAAMILSKYSSGSFEQIPTGNLALNSVDDSLEIFFDADGRTSVKERRILRGFRAYIFREVLRTTPSQNIETIMQSQLSYFSGNVRLDSFVITGQETYNSPLILDLLYSLDNLITITPDEIILKTGDLLTLNPNGNESIDSVDRRNPIKISYDEQYTKNVAVHFPQDWTMVTTLDSTTVYNRLGSRYGNFSIDDGALNINQFLRLNKAFGSKDEINSLAALIGGPANAAIPAIVFRRAGMDKSR